MNRDGEKEKNKQKNVNKVLGVLTNRKKRMFWLCPGIAAEENVYETPFAFLA